MLLHRSIKRILYLVCWALIVAHNIAQGQHIQPIPSQDDGSRGDPKLVDVSGLGPEGTDFYDMPSIDIQLEEDGPTWTVYRLAHIDSHFAGESNDGMVAANLLRYQAGNSNAEVFTGLVHDRAGGMYYELKPDIDGNVEVLSTQREDMPMSALVQPEVQSIWTEFKALADYLATCALNLRRDPDKFVEIDVMIVWSHNAECAKAGLPVDCSVTDDSLNIMLAALNLTVEINNFVHANSQTNTSLKIVHAQRDTSGYRETDPFQLITELTIPLFDGQLNYIHPLRDQKKADLVAFAYDNRIVENPGYGIANAPVPVFGLQGLPLPPFLAFSVFCIQCSAGTLQTHEWGHNLGCTHDRGTVTDQIKDAIGDNPFNACEDKTHTNYGYRSPTGTFHTVMSYRCREGQCDNWSSNTANGFCAEIPYFSGKDTWRNGESMGGEENNCRDRIKRDKHFIARNR
ncbi:expressed unknown protein [Seminavis robusta]|uniref:Peptidase M43 pregnancy-associated plasma-A domain-containing protein n=1 Tax=Seminavis robusta TaxID=568900 RepID=A0A9N8HFV5_9STRA|nr:expressed unknown protein [Seminavis robusta]|eukprot:Sro367_g127800.1 n/a (457) ;mRNA; r:52222-53759